LSDGKADKMCSCSIKPNRKMEMSETKVIALTQIKFDILRIF
jgi:hypothetical protein